MYFDESAWVALGFVIFIALVWKKAGLAISDLLDKRVQKIKNDLEEAESLRIEAEKELKKFKGMQKEAINDAKRIVADAQVAADRILSAANEKANESIKRREAQAEAKIAAAEAAVISELRTKAASIAISASKEILSSELNGELNSSIIDDSVSQITAAK